MQRKSQATPTPIIDPCTACGMMSFPSQNGVFSATAGEKPVVAQSEASIKTLYSDDDLRALLDCEACGMMSFPSPTPTKKY